LPRGAGRQAEVAGPARAGHNRRAAGRMAVPRPARPPAGGGGPAPRPAADEDAAARAAVRSAEPPGADGRDRAHAGSSRPRRADRHAEGQDQRFPYSDDTNTDTVMPVQQPDPDLQGPSMPAKHGGVLTYARELFRLRVDKS